MVVTGDGDSVLVRRMYEPVTTMVSSVAPDAARYDTTAREFLLSYETLCAAPNPDEALLRFFQTTYEAAADLGHWDRKALDRPELVLPRRLA